jgi:hypothetical protein
MPDAELLSRWYVILAIAAALVAVVAILVITIIVIARGIDQAARRCHRAVQKIVGNTLPIWNLDATNAAAWELRVEVRSIRQHAEEIAAALQAPAGPRA